MENSSTSAAAYAYPLLVQRYGIGGCSPATATATAARVFSLPAMKLLDVTLPDEMMREGNTFLETPQGLVLVLSSSSPPVSSPSSTFLLDPRNGSRVAELPALDESELPEHRRCVLSDRSPSPGCGVLVFDLESPSMLFCRVGGERWSKHGYDIGCYDLPEEYCPVPKKKKFFDVVGVGGRFYFHENLDELGTLDFTGSDGDGDGQEKTEAVLGAIAIPVLDYFPADHQEMYSAMTYLIGSCGELFKVAITFEGYNIGGPYDVHVFRMDFSASEWRRTTDIGDRAFVVDNFSGASCSASGCGVKANRIYWLNGFSEDEKSNLYVITVDDGSVETVDTFEALPGAPRQTLFWLV